jgi:hypothetical protein
MGWLEESNTYPVGAAVKVHFKGRRQGFPNSSAPSAPQEVINILFFP